MEHQAEREIVCRRCNVGDVATVDRLNEPDDEEFAYRCNRCQHQFVDAAAEWDAVGNGYFVTEWVGAYDEELRIKRL